MKRIYFLILFIAVVLNLSFMSYAEEQAIELPFQALDSLGKDTSSIHQIDYDSDFILIPGEILHITSQYPISSLYIVWDSPVTPWTMVTADGVRTFGENGFLHEFITLDKSYTDMLIQVNNQMAISYIRVFSEGIVPDDIQIWNSPNERADILLVSAHADDEVLHLGGTVPNSIALYDAKVQVIYITQFWDEEPFREHEKLDGLWTMGIKYYPECLGYGDYYNINDLTKAHPLYDPNVITEYLVSQIRRFQPQVIVTHDFAGEYTHGLHVLTAQCVVKAVEAAADQLQYPASGIMYGTWNTPKEYIHLYDKNALTLDLHIPLAMYNGNDAMEVVRQAYAKHASQQRYKRFYVGDDYKWSCAKFGLYRSTVGPDYTNDIFCNIVPYSQQAATNVLSEIGE